MKKNFLIAAASVGLMLGAVIAEAADVAFSGQFRPRMQTRNHDFNENTQMHTFFETRVRLNANVKANDQVGAFIQLQSVGNWGFDSSSNSDGTRFAVGGAGTQASDQLDDVGLHQAYMTIKNFYGSTFDLKIGRQEVVIDGHRLFGHTGWTSGAQTNDALRLTHAGGNHALNYTFIKGREEAASVATAADTGSAHNDDNDYNMHIIHASTQGIMGGALSGIFVLTDDNNSNGGMGNEWYTLGARQKGKLGALDYRVEYYHQFGDACADACGTYAYTTETLDSSVERDASMFGIRLGKTFKNATYSPTVTLWYDYLSGTDDADVTAGDYATFDTIQDTGHKFYGFMDLFLARNGAKENRLGLQDIAIKTKFSPKAGWTFKADYHKFLTDVDLSSNTTIAAIAMNSRTAPGTATDWSKDLGSEIDLTLVHKYNSSVKVVYGYSHYWNSALFAATNPANKLGNGTASNENNDGSDWAYMMIDMKF